ncbi:hypothetical protein DFP72DRAFT_1093166 [Ephemerocybe angulata]|uniref:Uncharacterized protein n=1 Tax=Ephemerocybe angulata TaxID=980116 RepID=A0A8H6HDB3_9AGAR|nr:hypothetical protein DFP72DRAFT_1093166 [Tulosesus angulatus]
MPQAARFQTVANGTAVLAGSWTRPQEADLTIGAIGYTTTLLARGDTVAHWIAFWSRWEIVNGVPDTPAGMSRDVFLALYRDFVISAALAIAVRARRVGRPTIYTIHVNVRRLTRLRSRLRDIVFSPGFNFDRYLNRPVSMSNTPLYETLHRPGAVRRRRRSQG